MVIPLCNGKQGQTSMYFVKNCYSETQAQVTARSDGGSSTKYSK